MTKIKWFEKYGLGTIDIIAVNETTGLTRYKISKKLHREISAESPTSWYINPRVADNGAALTFSLETRYGVDAIFGSTEKYNNRMRKWFMSRFSRRMLEAYSK